MLRETLGRAMGVLCLLAAGAYACGSSTEDGAGGENGKPGGSSCTAYSDCQSGVCSEGVCTASGQSAGSACTSGRECESNACVSGVCASAPPGPDDTPTTAGPQYPGSGKGFRPMIPGCGPDTADQCTGQCETNGGDPSEVIRPPATLCFSGEGDPTPNDPAVVIEQVIERINGKDYIHLRITFDPAFVDNTFGTGACCGWDKHSFNELVGSDHTELLLTDGMGNTVMNFRIDYISQDPSSSCGYGSLGVTGGEGRVIEGDPAAVVAVTTSLDRNLNGCGYCETVDSPATDANYTPNGETANWDYRVVYEVWLDLAAFGDAGFGQAYVTYVHASPAKASSNTIEVLPVPCPPEWDEPYCPPSIIEEGGNCGSPNDGGTGCPPNFTLYTTTEGASDCVPIPYANYPDKQPCPVGYQLDLASEGRYCLPIE